MLIGHQPLWRGGMEVGVARGQGEPGRCGPAAADPTPWGALEPSGLSELACFVPKGPDVYTPHIGPPWQGQDPG